MPMALHTDQQMKRLALEFATVPWKFYGQLPHAPSPSCPIRRVLLDTPRTAAKAAASPSDSGLRAPGKA